MNLRCRKSKKFMHPVIWLESKPKLAWTLAILYAVIIFILSSFPYGPPEPSFIAVYPSTPKHIIEYSVLGFFLFAAFRSNEKTKRLALLFAVITAGFYGMTDEFHQMFVPHRIASLYDVVADFVGGFFGAFLMRPRVHSIS